MEGNCKHICFNIHDSWQCHYKKSTNLQRKRFHFHVMCSPYRVSKKNTIDSSALQSVKNMWLQLNVYVIISCSHLRITCHLTLIFMVIQYLFFKFGKILLPQQQESNQSLHHSTKFSKSSQTCPSSRCFVNMTTNYQYVNNAKKT